MCVELAKRGYHVIVNYVSSEAKALETLTQIRETGGDGELLKFDVADRAAVADALVWMEDEDWDRVLDTSLGGFYNVTRLLIKPMILRKFGRVVNVASLSGLKGLPGQCNYSAAKGGLIAATKALAQEVARKGVTVNAVAPGFIRTDMVEGLDEAELRRTIPAGRFGTPEEVASLVGFLVSKEASYITGQCIGINGGLY